MQARANPGGLIIIGGRRATVSACPDTFTVCYEQRGVAVGVLTHEADADYELGQRIVEAHGAIPSRRHAQ